MGLEGIGLLSLKKQASKDVEKAADWDGLTILDQISNMESSPMMKIRKSAASSLLLEAGGP